MKHFSARKAFTLVELLVVMSLIVVLAGFAIMFFPNAASSARESRAATVVKSTLDIAKQRAMRDQSPRGVRFWIAKPDGSAYKAPDWAAGTVYTQFDSAMLGGVVYRCVAAHAATAANTPPGVNWQPTQLVTEMQYIEQPNDFTSDRVRATIHRWDAATTYPILTNVAYNGAVYYARQAVPVNMPPDTSGAFWTPNATIVSFEAADLGNGNRVLAGSPTIPTANNTDPDVKYWHVQPGDYFEGFGGQSPHRIQTVFPTVPGSTVAPFTPNRIAVTPPLPTSLTYPDRVSSPGLPLVPPTNIEFTEWTTTYRIIRAPRVVGDEVVKLPVGTLIDLDTNAVFRNPLPKANQWSTASAVDVLFAPNGAVISRGLTVPNLNLWVRAPAQEQESDVFRGEPSIVSVFVRSGLAGAYQPDPNQIVIVGVTNQQNATITTAGGHGLTVGQPITIFGVVGAVQVNGSWTVSEVQSATTFKIGNPNLAGNYTGGGAIRAPYRLVK